MEHEVFVPVPVPSVRRTLGDPARVARCVPGFQQDADASAGPLAGRLKFRADGHTITYRGALTLGSSDEDGSFSVTGEGVEARGAGSAKLVLTVGLTGTDGGTTIAFTGTVTGDGRIVDLDPAAALSAAQRLLDRFTQQLVTESLAARDGAPEADQPPAGEAAGTAGAHESAADEPSPGAGPAPGASAGSPDGAAAEGASAGSADTGPDDGVSADAGAGEGTSGGGGTSGVPASDASVPDASVPDEPVSDAPASDASASDASAGESLSGPSSPDASGEPPSSDKGSVFDAPVPPSSLDPSEELEFTVPDEPPAEAAHARRTMIGRSTEEVDHAPPRGRYAPVPSPEAGAAGIALRWAAPAAAVVIASAVVVGRALRRRRP
ncbi:SRPBCC domain-containing protein [Streptomyces sp. NPDC058008]|uniref:SRPBCC domain-containing protein n=1 Tax=Streptomyces sp. NPDC058008 TaxID=3346303 RepID=UPI0036EE6E13